MNIQQMSQFLDETINVGGEIKSWNIYRGKKLALDYGNDAYDKQFSLIPAFVNEFNKSNPKRKIQVFRCLFVSDSEFFETLWIE